MRFFAAIMVVAIHLRGLFGIPRDWAADVPLMQGVSFFFVLSGFILTHAYPRLATSTNQVNFWVARFARIFPLHLITLCLAIAVDTGKQEVLTTLYGGTASVMDVLLLRAWVPIDIFAIRRSSPEM